MSVEKTKLALFFFFDFANLEAPGWEHLFSTVQGLALKVVFGIQLSKSEGLSLVLLLFACTEMLR